jgi:serine/threonine protein kinase
MFGEAVRVCLMDESVLRLRSAPSLRRKWAAQIEQTVKELHHHGVVWGDAKPDNVVIDMDDNAWVLDFGGGGTTGWMPEEPSMFQTKEGGLHAVAKMKHGLWRMEDVECQCRWMVQRFAL